MSGQTTKEEQQSLISKAAIGWGQHMSQSRSAKAGVSIASIIAGIACITLIPFSVSEDWTRWPSTGWLVAFAIISQCANPISNVLEDLYEDYRERSTDRVWVATQALSEGLWEVQNKVAELHTKTPARKKDTAAEVAHLVIQQMLMTFGGSVNTREFRCNIHILEGNDTRLNVLDSRGRRDRSKPFYKSDTERSRDVFAWLLGDDKTPRTDANVPELTQKYKSFVSVAIYTKGRTFGMLSLDSPQEGAIDEPTKHLIQAYAGELATAFTISMPTMPTPQGRNQRGSGGHVDPNN